MKYTLNSTKQNSSYMNYCKYCLNLFDTLFKPFECGCLEINLYDVKFDVSYTIQQMLFVIGLNIDLRNIFEMLLQTAFWLEDAHFMGSYWTYIMLCKSTTFIKYYIELF